MEFLRVNLLPYLIFLLLMICFGAAQAQVPNEPTNLVVTPINTGGMIHFTAPSNIGGSTITNYQYSTDNGSTWTSPSPAITTSPLIISSGLTNCNTYQVKLRAVNTSGSGTASSASQLIPATSVNMGVNWTTRTSAANNNWNGITYGNGLFVAVASDGTGNRVMTSPDGITWTIRTSAADNGWRSFTYGNGLFVAVANTGTGNRVMTSPDGMTWTIRTSAADNNWAGVTYANGLFVAVANTGAGNRVMTSPDGITWTIRTSAVDNNWAGVTYANGLFVAVASSGTNNRVMTSPDGITWTARTSAADNSWNGVTYGNGLVVAVSSTGTGNRVMTSSYRIVANPPVINTVASRNAGSARVFFTASSSQYAPPTTNYEYSTDDGVTFTALSPSSNQSPITFGGLTIGSTYAVRIRAVNSVGASCVGSSVSVTIVETVPGIPENLVATGINTGGMIQFVHPNEGGSSITNYEYSLDNGQSWVSPSPAVTQSPLIISSGLTNCTSYQVKLRAVNSAGSGNASSAVQLIPATSVDMGMNWTQRTPAADNNWASVTYANGLFVAVAASGTGNRVMTSPDGITWTIRTSAADNNWSGVTYANGLFVAVASSGTGNRVMTSPDGITWTALNVAADLDWNSVTYGNGLFVAVATTGVGNRVMTSPDGITWTIRTSAADNFWTGVTYGNGLFVAVATSGTGNRVMTSPDGITWTSRTSASDNPWVSVTYGNGLFVAVAFNGTGNRVMTSPDGITWTSRTSAANISWNSVSYGNGMFVAVAITGTGNRVMTSPDGITWTSRTSTADNSWTSVTYGNGLFVAVSRTGTGNRVMTSGYDVVADAPVITSATLGSTSTVNFTQSGSVYATAISNYQYSTDNGSNWTAVSPAATTSPLTITGLAGTTNAIILRAVNSVGNSCSSNIYPVTTWNGSTNTDWSTAANWTPAVVPGSANTVFIPSGLSNYPVISTNVSIAELTLAASTTIDLSTYNLTLSGNLTNNGRIFGSGIVLLSGSSPQMVAGTGTVKHITINNASGVMIAMGSNKLNVLGVLTPTAGTITTNGNLVLKGTLSEEGTIGQVGTCPTNPFIGNVTVERFIPGKQRAHRFLTPGVTTTTSINANWQEGATSSTNNPNPGYGTHITGSTSGANGLDATLTGSASLYTYNNTTQAWSAITNTLTSTLKAGQGYQVFLRGSRAIDLANLTPPTPDNTVIRSTGALSVCNVNLTTSSAVPLSNAGTGWSFIDNPYWSIVDLTTVTKTNIESTYYYWDPTLSGANNRGAYATLTIDGIGGETSSILGSQVSKYLQPGQGFFIRNTSSAPSLTFKESDKVASATNKKLIFQKNPVRPPMVLGVMDNGRTRGNGRSVTEKIYLSLFLKENLNVSPADGFAVTFNSNYKNKEGAEDAHKLTNPDENIAAMYDGKRYAILGLQESSFVNSDTIPITMWNLNDKDYVLQVNLTEYVDPQCEIFLLNKTTCQTTKVDNMGTFDYAFRPSIGVKTKDDLALVINTSRIAPAAHLSKDIVVFPNPTSDGLVRFTITKTAGSLNLDEGGQVELFDGGGRKVMQRVVQLIGSRVGQIDLGNLTNGVYTLKVMIGQHVFTSKVIKQ